MDRAFAALVGISGNKAIQAKESLNKEIAEVKKIKKTTSKSVRNGSSKSNVDSKNDTKSSQLSSSTLTTDRTSGSSTTVSTSSTDQTGSASDLADCPICKTNLKKSKMQTHFQKCLLTKFQHKPSDKNETEVENEKTEMEEECFFCHICQRDLSRLNSTRKTQHLNRCIDKKEKEQTEQRSKERKAAETWECPICGKLLKTVNAQRVHAKKCAASNGVNTEQVIKLLQKQQEEREIKQIVDTAEGETNLVIPNPQTKCVNNVKRKRLKEPKGKFDEEMQIALAMSSSLAETEVNLTPWLPGQSVEVKSRHGKKKQNRSEGEPLLLQLTEEEKHKRMGDNVSTLLLSQENTNDDALAVNEEKYLKQSRCNSQGIQEYSLWQKGSLLNGHDNKPSEKLSFYVRALMPPLEPSTFVTGSKLRRMSEIPGRNEKSKVESAEPKSLKDGVSLDDKLSYSMEGSFMATTQTAIALAELESGDISQTNSCSNNSHLDVLRNTNEEIGGFCEEEVIKPQMETSTEATNILKQQLFSLIDNPTHSDVVIVTQDAEIRVHAAILSIRCPVLLKMNCGGRIPLENERSDIVKCILGYVYTSELNMKPSQIKDTIALALRLKLDDLVDICDSMHHDNEMEECEDVETESFEDLTKILDVESDTEDNVKNDHKVEDDEDISDDDYFDILCTQRQKLRRSNTLVSKGSQQIQNTARGSVGETTQREISSFFRVESSDESEAECESDRGQHELMKVDGKIGVNLDKEANPNSALQACWGQETDRSQDSAVPKYDASDNLLDKRKSPCQSKSSYKVTNVEKLFQSFSDSSGNPVKFKTSAVIHENKGNQLSQCGENFLRESPLIEIHSQRKVDAEHVDLNHANISKTSTLPDKQTLFLKTELYLTKPCSASDVQIISSGESTDNSNPDHGTPDEVQIYSNSNHMDTEKDGRIMVSKQATPQSSQSGFQNHESNSGNDDNRAGSYCLTPDKSMDVSGTDLFGTPSPIASQSHVISSDSDENSDYPPPRKRARNSMVCDEVTLEVGVVEKNDIGTDNVQICINESSPSKSPEFKNDDSKMNMFSMKTDKCETDLSLHESSLKTRCDEKSCDKIICDIEKTELPLSASKYKCDENESKLKVNLKQEVDLSQSPKFKAKDARKFKFTKTKHKFSGKEYTCNGSKIGNQSQQSRQNIRNGVEIEIECQKRTSAVDNRDSEDDCFIMQEADDDGASGGDVCNGQVHHGSEEFIKSGANLERNLDIESAIDLERAGYIEERHGAELNIDNIDKGSNSNNVEQEPQVVLCGDLESVARHDLDISDPAEDVWEGFEDAGMGGDLLYMESPPAKNTQKLAEGGHDNVVEVDDVPDIPQPIQNIPTFTSDTVGIEADDFSDSFTVPSDDITDHIQGEINFKTPITSKTASRKEVRGEKGQSKSWIPPSPFTPMPNYSAMATPVLKKEVQKYGVKPITKKKMILVLQDIYQKTHDYETDSDLDVSMETLNEKEERIEKEVNEVTHKEYDSDLNSSQTSTKSDTSDLIEESFMDPAIETDVLATQDSKGDLKEKFTEFLSKRADIHALILTYEPLELDWLKKEMADSGIKTSIPKLMDFLDEKCITFTMKNRRNNSPRKRRRKKKKETSKS